MGKRGKMREKYLRFIALLGAVYSITIGDAWWYSLTHEKNTSISKAYHHLCKGIVEKEKWLLIKCFLSAIKKYFTFIYRYYYFWRYNVEVKKEVLVGYAGLIDNLKTKDNTIIYIPQRKDYNRIEWEQIIAIDSFIKLSDFIIVLFKYIIISFNFLFIQQHYGIFKGTAELVGDLPKSIYDIHKKDLYHSFTGGVLIEGLFFERAFKNLAKRDIKKIIYVYEGRAWEKALCLAFPDTTKIGVMYSLPCLNTLQMHYDLIDIIAMPQPNYLAVMGKKSKEIMERTYKDKVFILGTTRHDHLKEALNKEVKKDGEFITVIMHVNDDRNKELLDVVKVLGHDWSDDAFLMLGEVLIKMAPHPDSNLKEELFFEMFKESTGQIIRHKGIEGGSLDWYLKNSAAVIVTSSSVAMEAMAYGVPSIVPELKSYVSIIPKGVVICKDLLEAFNVKVNRDIVRENYTFTTKEKMREILDEL